MSNPDSGIADTSIGGETNQSHVQEEDNKDWSEHYRNEHGEKFDPFEATDKDDRGYDEDLHQSHADGTPVISSGGNLKRKPGLGDVGPSDLGGDQEEDEPEQLTPEEAAEQFVDQVTGSLQMFLGEQWEPDTSEREKLIRAQTELHKRYGYVDAEFPWWVNYLYIWGMEYIYPRATATEDQLGPSGLFGMIDLYTRLTTWGSEEEEPDPEEEDVPDPERDYRDEPEPDEPDSPGTVMPPAEE